MKERLRKTGAAVSVVAALAAGGVAGWAARGQDRPVASVELGAGSSQNENGLAPGSVVEVFKAGDALAYPTLVTPDPSRQPVFPDVPFGGRPALLAYETPFESGDYFQHRKGDIDVPQFYYRVMTAGEVTVDQLGVSCKATKDKGCAVILINHFGPTAMFRDATADNGFTVAGRVFDMGTPDKTTLAAQALLDHYMGRMTGSTEGANCSTIEACPQVEWHVVVFGNGEPQQHWAGLFSR